MIQRPNELPDEILFNIENLPGWAIAYLENIDLPLKLYPEIMTDDQKLKFNLFASLMYSVKQGFVEATVEDGMAFFQITEEGRKHINLTQNQEAQS